MAMNRRDAIKSFALMMGGTMVGANAILTGCAPEDQIVGLEFSPKDRQTILLTHGVNVNPKLTHRDNVKLTKNALIPLLSVLVR